MNKCTLTPNQQYSIIEQVYLIWLANPHLRLGQLMDTPALNSNLNLSNMNDFEYLHKMNETHYKNDINNRALTPNQKRSIIEQIYAIWLANPYMRLGQLLNIAAVNGNVDLYYVEDFDLLDKMKETNYEEWVKE